MGKEGRLIKGKLELGGWMGRRGEESEWERTMIKGLVGGIGEQLIANQGSHDG